MYVLSHSLGAGPLPHPIKFMLVLSWLGEHRAITINSGLDYDLDWLLVWARTVKNLYLWSVAANNAECRRAQEGVHLTRSTLGLALGKSQPPFSL